jgi:hypothetical protein
MQKKKKGRERGCHVWSTLEPGLKVLRPERLPVA